MKKYIKYLIIAAIIIAILVGYYLISPLFIKVEVDEALPENIITEKSEDADINEAEPSDEVASGVEKLTEEEKIEMEKLTDEVEAVPAELMSDPMPENAQDEPSEEEEKILKTFPVIGTKGHPASGDVRVLETASGQVVRYENFSTINGPSLHVYLTNDLEANDFIDLGEAKGTKGNINYPVPKTVNASEYRYVMYWCVPFRVLFNYAEINN